MQVNKFVTMAVGLVVGVMLIAGVVTPVIANMSSDGGGSAKSYTNTGGEARYSYVDENTSFTIYPAGNDIISLQPESVENRETFYCDGWVAYLKEIGEYKWYYAEEDDGVCLFDGYTSLTIEGTVLTGNLPNGSSDIIASDVLCYMDPNGDYVDSISWIYNEETDHYDGSIGTAYVFKDTPIFVEIDVYEENEDDWYYFFVYGNSTTNYVGVEGDVEYGDHATYSFREDVLSSIALTIDGTVYDVPIPAQGQNVEGIAVGGLLFDIYSLIVPINVVEGEGKVIDINAEPPYYGEKMGMEMGHFTENIPEITLSFTKGVDEQGNPCFVHHSYDAGIPNVYAHSGEILYASQYCVAFVKDNLNGSNIGVQIFYLSRDNGGSGGDVLIPNVVIATNSVEIEARYGSIYPIADGTPYYPESATDPNYGVFFPMYNEGISEWDQFIERGIYTIRDGNARVDSLPIIGGAYSSDDALGCLPSLLNGYTYNGSVVTFEYDLSDGIVSNLHGQVSGDYNEVYDNGYSVLGYDLIIPEDDEEEGGGSDSGDSGNGISSTIKTTLAVIPLVMTVGLVLGAVTYLRTKN